MGIQLYSTKASRNLIRAELDMLDYADKIVVIGKFGENKMQPLKKTDTVVFRRVKPVNATAAEVPDITASDFVIGEGSVPNARTIDYTDVSSTLQNFGILFKMSSRAELMYEDDIPGDMVELTGRTLGEVAEKVAYGMAKAGTSVIYANGSTRVGINSPLHANLFRLADRSLEDNRAPLVTSMINPGPDFGTSSVEPSFVVFCHTHTKADIRNMPDFTKRVDYGSAIKPLHEREFGAFESCRFITSPVLGPFLAAGAAVGSTGMYSVGGSNIDVYPTIVMAEKALGHISLKGHGYTGIKPTTISSQTINHMNPVGTFGYVGASFWYQCVRLNENRMLRIESAVTDLTV